ncbi:T9SS type A sorting domain-containing protein, partial [bacterium]|nr:T9SS type A sorting domain-containing protein [bacterium]
GDNWEQKYKVNSIIYSIAIDGNNIYLGTYEEGVYKSTDYGTTWEQKGFVNSYIPALAIYKSNVFAGSFEGGVYLSSNQGTTWERIGLDTLIVNEFIIDGDYIFAQSGIGFYRAKLSDLVSDVKEDAKRSSHAIFPNPSLDFINTEEYLGWHYQIYDLLGNCMQSGLIDSDNITIASLPTGIYTVRFFKGGEQKIEKLIKE